MVVHSGKNVVFEAALPVLVSCHHVGAHDNAALAPLKFAVQLGLVSVDVVNQPHRRRVHAHRVRAAVHAVF